MKIAVLVKRVPDTASVFKVGSDNKSVETGNLKFVMSPYDEHAMEAAIAGREADKADEVIVFSMGDEKSPETIRTALAMGGDRAVLVKDAATAGLSQKGTAEVLAAALRTENPDLILAGKQAVDDDASQVPERIAELLDLPHASVVTRFELGDGTVSIDREIEGGHYSMEIPTPAVFTMQKGVNTPRYPTLPNIMKAKKKEIKEFTIADLGLNLDDLASGLEVKEMATPRQERLNKIIEGENAERVEQLVSILRQEEKVL